MTRPCLADGKRNLIAERLINLRREHGFSQRELASQLQLLGMDMDKNVITRIETNKRYVTDLELQALVTVFNITYEDLLGIPIASRPKDTDHQNGNRSTAK